MSKWIAEFELEDGDTMPEHMDLEYKGVRIDFHCKPLEQEPKSEWQKDHEILKAYSDGANEVLDKIYTDIQKLRGCSCSCSDGIIDDVEDILDKYKGESEVNNG